jgi:hypothetical protein
MVTVKQNKNEDRTEMNIFSLNKNAEDNSENGRKTSKAWMGPALLFRPRLTHYTAKEMSEDRGRSGESPKRGCNRLIPYLWSEKEAIYHFTNNRLLECVLYDEKRYFI